MYLEYILNNCIFVSGNEHIHMLTEYRQTLHICLRDANGIELNMTWEKFCVTGEEDNYRMIVVSLTDKTSLGR